MRRIELSCPEEEPSGTRLSLALLQAVKRDTANKAVHTGNLMFFIIVDIIIDILQYQL
ncbi:hypothetical protein [Pedobacter sp. NJ-S-72]